MQDLFFQILLISGGTSDSLIIVLPNIWPARSVIRMSIINGSEWLRNLQWF